MNQLAPRGRKGYVPDLLHGRVGQKAPCTIYRIDVGYKHSIALPYLEEKSGGASRNAVQLGFTERYVLVSGAWGTRTSNQQLREECASAVQAVPSGMFVDLDPVTQRLQNGSTSAVREAIAVDLTASLDAWKAPSTPYTAQAGSVSCCAVTLLPRNGSRRLCSQGACPLSARIITCSHLLHLSRLAPHRASNTRSRLRRCHLTCPAIR